MRKLITTAFIAQFLFPLAAFALEFRDITLFYDPAHHGGYWYTRTDNDIANGIVPANEKVANYLVQLKTNLEKKGVQLSKTVQGLLVGAVVLNCKAKFYSKPDDAIIYKIKDCKLILDK